MDPTYDRVKSSAGTPSAARQPIRFAGSVLDAQRHVCAFFHNPDEEYRVLLPFIKDGFERGEKAFHIVDPNPSSSRRVYERVAEREGKKLPRLSLGYKLTDRLLKLPGLEKLTREQRMAFATVNHLSFYSSRNTLEILDGTGISCPPIENYLDRLMEYAQRARSKCRAPS